MEYPDEYLGPPPPKRSSDMRLVSPEYLEKLEQERDEAREWAIRMMRRGKRKKKWERVYKHRAERRLRQISSLQAELVALKAKRCETCKSWDGDGLGGVLRVERRPLSDT